MDYRLQNLKIALLAQLVARGSDKAKVIGSSPVESKIFFVSDFPGKALASIFAGLL